MHYLWSLHKYIREYIDFLAKNIVSFKCILKYSFLIRFVIKTIKIQFTAPAGIRLDGSGIGRRWNYKSNDKKLWPRKMSISPYVGKRPGGLKLVRIKYLPLNQRKTKKFKKKLPGWVVVLVQSWTFFYVTIFTGNDHISVCWWVARWIKSVLDKGPYPLSNAKEKY